MEFRVIVQLVEELERIYYCVLNSTRKNERRTGIRFILGSVTYVKLKVMIRLRRVLRSRVRSI